jgi:hypothetical protein
MAVGVTLALAVVAGMPASIGNAGTPDHKVTGKGRDSQELKFEFKAKLKEGIPSGHVFFETFSFGDPEGDVDCVNVERHFAAISGVITTPPVSSLTHFLLIMRDRRRDGDGKRDLYVSWMRNGPFDCNDPEELDNLGGDSLMPIKKGDLSVE